MLWKLGRERVREDFLEEEAVLRNIRINKLGKRKGRMCKLNVQEPDREEEKMKV